MNRVNKSQTGQKETYTCRGGAYGFTRECHTWRKICSRRLWNNSGWTGLGNSIARVGLWVSGPVGWSSDWVGPRVAGWTAGCRLQQGRVSQIEWSRIAPRGVRRVVPPSTWRVPSLTETRFSSHQLTCGSLENSPPPGRSQNRFQLVFFLFSLFISFDSRFKSNRLLQQSCRL